MRHLNSTEYHVSRRYNVASKIIIYRKNAYCSVGNDFNNYFYLSVVIGNENVALLSALLLFYWTCPSNMETRYMVQRYMPTHAYWLISSSRCLRLECAFRRIRF